MTTYMLDVLDAVARGAGTGALLALGSDQFDALAADVATWQALLGGALGGALLALATALATTGIGRKGSPLIHEAER